MLHKDILRGRDSLSSTIIRALSMEEVERLIGIYHVECFDKYGNLKWQDAAPNLITTVGKNHMLDNYLAGSAFTQTGPFMGLISSVSYSAISAADTMTSHSGWTEAGGTNAPTYSGTRKTCAWSAASAGSKSLSAALAFVFGSTGTIKGCFLTLGSGAVNTIDNTGGTLFSAGLFTTGDRAVNSGDTVNASYSASI